MDDSKESGYYLGLDALRGWAIIAVVILHSGGLALFKYSYPLGTLIESGQLGVQLFYLLSAFSLCLSLENRRTEKLSIVKYFIRRIARIAPLYYVVLLYYLVIGWGAYDVLRILTVVTLTNGFFLKYCTGIANGSWSISVEMVFYFILPVLFKYFMEFNRMVMLIGIAAFVANKLITSGVENAYYFIGYQIGVFLIGCLLYIMWKYKNIKVKPIFLIPIIIYIMLGKTLHQHFIFAIACSFLIIGGLNNSEGFFYGYWIRFVGKISYGIYLIHFIVMDVIDRFNPLFFGFDNEYLRLISRFSLIMGISIVVSVVTFIFIEKPSQIYVASRLKKWI